MKVKRLIVLTLMSLGFAIMFIASAVIFTPIILMTALGFAIMFITSAVICTPIILLIVLIDHKAFREFYKGDKK